MTIPAIINKSVALSIGKLKQPVITKYQLGVLIFKSYLSNSGRKILKTNKRHYSTVFDQILEKLLEIGVINENKNFPEFSVFNILGKDDSESEEIICTIDPFSYVSHLSAMSYHGLTDRMPKMIFISSPASRKWSPFAQKLMKKDLGEDFNNYRSIKLPKLQRIRLDKINKQVINRYSSMHYGAFKSIKGKNLRISTIGRTFLDMLRRPDLCGGIHHVIEIFKEFGPQYLGLIVDEIDRHGKQIDKVRAGYILEEVCEQKNKTIDSWIKFVQRGGSRKLDPSEEYSHRYSERWCLSINID
jgi:predicted transcriptional regulator of viral defense system